jgi:MFS family permease
MERRILYTTFLAHLIDDGCEMVLFPLLPLIAKEFSFSDAQIGLIGGIIVITAGIFQFITGYISDYLKMKKNLVAFGFFLMAVSFFLVSLGSSFFSILLFSSFIGIGLAFYHPIGISVITTHITTGRGKAIGIHGMGGAVGLLIFPAYSGFVADLYGWRTVLHITSCICVLMAALYYFSIKDLSMRRTKRRLSLIFSVSAILVMVVLGLTAMSSRGFSTFFPVHLERIGYSSRFYGSLLSVFLGIGILGQYIGGVLSDAVSVSYRKIISSSLVLTAVFFIFLLRAEGSFQLYLFAALTGLFMSIVWPAVFAYVADTTPQDMHSRALGIYGTVSAVMGGSSPILIGTMTHILPLSDALFFLPVVALTGAALMMVVRR